MAEFVTCLQGDVPFKPWQDHWLVLRLLFIAETMNFVLL
jgi:hypothetical protein